MHPGTVNWHFFLQTNHPSRSVHVKHHHDHLLPIPSLKARSYLESPDDVECLLLSAPRGVDSIMDLLHSILDHAHLNRSRRLPVGNENNTNIHQVSDRNASPSRQCISTYAYRIGPVGGGVDSLLTDDGGDITKEALQHRVTFLIRGLPIGPYNHKGIQESVLGQ